MENRKLLRSGGEIKRAVEALADALIGEFGADRFEDVALLGIYRKGVPLAERIATAIEQRCGIRPALGKLDISMYRDDFGLRSALPLIRETEIPFAVEGAKLILVDDVLSTGRTIRAALDAVTDYGRADLIRLAVLVNRGGIEYPIHADYVGFEIPTPANRKVVVEFSEDGGEEGIYEVAWNHDAKKNG